jgi:hypothetical protein
MMRRALRGRNSALCLESCLNVAGFLRLRQDGVPRCWVLLRLTRLN